MNRNDSADPPRTAGPAEGAPPQTRRSFFRKSALAAGPAALLMAGTAKAAGIQVPELYPDWAARNFSEIRSDENAHVAFLESALGSNALPAQPLNTAALTIPTENPILFAAYASVFENTGSMTYFTAAPLIYSKTYLSAAASIYGIECYHSGFINTLIDFPIGPNAPDGSPAQFVPTFPVQNTLQNISPFLLNPSAVAQLAESISTTPSEANDITILNFALVLERLEQAFYNINVVRFFGV